jgi:glyoxylase-like metal-dependent hydrolase (beta-lactamase superfamily II)
MTHSGATHSGAERPPDREIGVVTVLVGDRAGKYPDGNSLLVRGTRETALIDPGLGLLSRNPLPRVDRVLFSHCHEDHIAGSHLFPDAAWHVHRLDRVGFDSIDDMMSIYGYPEPIHSAFRKQVLERFHYTSRDDVESFEDGDVFDLGDVTLEVHHTPGHTRGHSCLLVEWQEGGVSRQLLHLGDIDLTSFGPYYGDAWSDLANFERSLERVRNIQAHWYATFHHIGVLERDAFLQRLDRFECKILEREDRLLEYLDQPRSLDEIAAHRFVYRPSDAVPFADAVERRSMSQHLERLIAQDRVEEVEPGCFVRAPGT